MINVEVKSQTEIIDENLMRENRTYGLMMGKGRANSSVFLSSTGEFSAECYKISNCYLCPEGHF